MHTTMWRTFSVFSKTTNSLIAVASIADLGAGRFRIGDQTRFERGVDPGARDDLRAVGRCARFLILDLALNILFSDHTFLNQ